MIKLCFVCLGNICRSPMAEAMMRQAVRERKWQDKIEVDSRATAGWNVGQAPHPGTRQVLDLHHIDYQGIRSRQLEAEDKEKFDYIIGMETANLNAIYEIIGPSEKVYRLLDFTDQPGNIDDPYYTENFDLTYQLIDKGIKGLVNYLENTYHLP